MLKKFKAFVQGLFLPSQNKYEAKVIVVGEQKFLLRLMLSEDIKELIALEKDIYFGETPWTRSAFLSEIHSPIRHLYLCILQKGEILGFVGSRVIGNDCHITNVAVKSAWQGQGIGSLLIDEVEKFAMMNDCASLSLEVRVSNQDAQRLYRKLGFEARSIRSNYYTESSEDALDMVKKIGEPYEGIS